MPTILTLNGWRFFFYSWEGMPREPRHIHVTGKGGAGKFWLDPVRYDSSRGINAKDLRDITAIVQAHAELFRGKWDVHFSE